MKRTGQTITEFLLMLSLLSILGIYFMFRMTGTESQKGAINQLQETATTKIANDD